MASCFKELFSGCRNLVKAPEVSLYNLSESCCDSMFYNCTNLITPPSKLPSKTSEGLYGCYASMFYNCTKLESIPEIDLERIGNSCCSVMFSGCYSLQDASNCVLKSKSLARNCYSIMFDSCSNLIYPPKMEAEYGEYGACNFMFSECGSLIESPVLKIKDIGYEWIYERMFYRCTSLEKITCLAEEGIYEDSVSDWVYDVSGRGTFYAYDSSLWERGNSGIPWNWDIVDAS